LRHGLPNGSLLNINVPSAPAASVRGVKVTRLGKRLYRDDVVKQVDPRGKDYYWIGGKEPIWLPGEETDFDAVDQG